MNNTLSRSTRKAPADNCCNTPAEAHDIASCPTYHRILETSVSLIQTEGFKALTVRRVASEAGVNIAAVNYHFKSKENLIDAVMSVLAAPLVKKINELALSSLSPRQKLRDILSGYAHYVQEAPQFLIRSLTVEGQKIHQNHSFIEIKRTAISEIKKIVAELFPEMDEVTLLVTVSQLFGAVAMPALFIPFSKPVLDKLNLSFPSIDERTDILLDNYLRDRK